MDTLWKRWFLPAAARARGQSNDLNREILASNLFNCCKEVINAPPVPSISRCIHIVYRHKTVWEYQWSNFIYNCMSTFLHYVHCKDALLDCSAPGGERCESLTRVDEISSSYTGLFQAKCSKKMGAHHTGDWPAGPPTHKKNETQSWPLHGYQTCFFISVISNTFSLTRWMIWFKMSNEISRDIAELLILTHLPLGEVAKIFKYHLNFFIKELWNSL